MSRTALIAGGVAWLLAFALMAAGVRYGRNIYDEGLILTGAMETLAGRWPVTGFWAIYPPGAFAWVAGLFLLTGPQMLAMRLAFIAFIGLVPALLAVLLLDDGEARPARRTRHIHQWIAIAGLACWLAGTLPNYGYPPPIAAAFAAIVLARTARTRRARGAFAGGLALGAIALIRHDIAAYAWAAMAVSFVIAEPRATDRASPALRRASLVLASGLGAAAVLCAVLAGYALVHHAGPRGQAAMALLWHRLIVYPAGPFRAARAIPFPVPFADVFAGAPWGPGLLVSNAQLVAVYGLAASSLILAAHALFARRPHRRVVALAVFAALVWIPFTGRADINQAWSGAALGAMVLLWQAGPRRRAAIGVVLALIGGLALIRQDLPYYRQPAVALASPYALGIRVPAGEASYNQVIAAAFQANSLYSGPETHSHVFANDMLLYFLSGHLPPTYFGESEPGMTDRASVQRRMVDDLRQAQPGLCVLLPQPRQEPNRSSDDSHVHIMDAFLDDHCGPAHRVGQYALRTCHWAKLAADPAQRR